MKFSFFHKIWFTYHQSHWQLNYVEWFRNKRILNLKQIVLQTNTINYSIWNKAMQSIGQWLASFALDRLVWKSVRQIYTERNSKMTVYPPQKHDSDCLVSKLILKNYVALQQSISLIPSLLKFYWNWQSCAIHEVYTSTQCEVCHKSICNSEATEAVVWYDPLV